jgi:protein-S-isoprenylcysteine O-methyltransferase Ste14
MPGLSTPFLVSIYCWFAWEGGLLVRDLVRRKGRLGSDRGTRVIVSLTLAGSIWIGILLRSWVPALDTPAPNAFAAVGVVVIWVGLALRVWAVQTLGRSFSTFIQVDADQAVVTRGPYRWVRHPSYTGLLLIALGFGLGVGNWLSLAICAVIPLGRVSKVGGSREMLRAWDEGTSLTSSGPGCSRCYPRAGRPAGHLDGANAS